MQASLSRIIGFEDRDIFPLNRPLELLTVEAPLVDVILVPCILDNYLAAELVGNSSGRVRVIDDVLYLQVIVITVVDAL